MYAYDVHSKQILNGPDWMDKDRFDITFVPDTERARKSSNRQWKTECSRNFWRTASS